MIHQEAAAAAEARWRASPTLQRCHPDLAAYLPKFSLGHIGETVAASTINTELAILQAIFDFAGKEKLADRKSLPAIHYQSLENQQVRIGFSEEELMTIRRAARRRLKEAKNEALQLYAKRHPDKTFLEILTEAPKDFWVVDGKAWGRFTLASVIDIMAYCGARPKTLKSLCRRHVHPVPVEKEGIDEDPLIGPDDEKTETGYMFRGSTAKGSNNRKRLVRSWAIVVDPLGWQAIANLLAQLPAAPDTPLIGISMHAVNDSFKRLLKDCNLDQAPEDGLPRSLYDLRHTYITQRLLEGWDPYEVAKNTMTSQQMIERYYDHLETTLKFEKWTKRRRRNVQR